MRKIIDLNFDWKFKDDFKKEYLNCQDIDNQVIVALPHTMKVLPLNYFNELDYQYIGTYTRLIELTKDMLDKNLVLEFLGVMTIAKVYLNGKLLIIHEGGYTPFKVDINEAAFEGENILQVIVDSAEIKDIPPFGKHVDYLAYSGIYREVRLHVLPKVYIKRAHLTTTEFDGLDLSKMILSIDLTLNQNKEEEFKVKASISFNGEITHRSEFDELISFKNMFNAKLDGILRWDLLNPNLYDCKIELLKDEVVIDEITERFGFRTAHFTPEGFLLNNEPVKLIGLNRHQSYPYVGYAMPKSMQALDADILKNLGCNIVRTSHYMQSDHFLNRCDEIGLLVLEETPGWQYIGNDHFKELTYQNIETMINYHFNHPSIVTWGVRINESADDHDFYKKTNDLAINLDPTRQTCGVRNFKKSELLEDIYTYNDFSHVGNNSGLEKPNKIVRGYVPYLVTEHNGHVFPTKSFDSESRRIEHAMRHTAVIDDAFSTNRISGAIGWCLADYNTHFNFGSNDRICYHGVTDMFRIPKYASYPYIAQKTTEPVLLIANNMIPGDFKEFRLPQIVIFSNCDYIKVYKNNEFIEKFYCEWKQFPDMPYAPFIIDDLVGDLIEKKEKYNKKTAKKFKDLLISFSRHGFNLPLKDKIKYLSLIMKKDIQMADFFNLFEKYIANQSMTPNVFRFEGYIDDKLVIEKEKGHSTNFNIFGEINTSILNHDKTYDVARIIVSLKDEYDNTLTYSNEVLEISTSKNLEVIGPSNVALIGGSIGIYIKTKAKSKKETVSIESKNYGKLKFEIEIK